MYCHLIVAGREPMTRDGFLLFQTHRKHTQYTEIEYIMARE